MGEVVEFKAIRRASLSAAIEGSAQILFFTGVRYVRQTLAAEPPARIRAVPKRRTRPFRQRAAR